MYRVLHTGHNHGTNFPSAHTGRVGLGEKLGDAAAERLTRQSHCTSLHSRDLQLTQFTSDHRGRTQCHMAFQGLGLVGAGYPGFSTLH
jgi:hypothetical protein